VFPVFVASACPAWTAALTTVFGAVDPPTNSWNRGLTFPSASSRPRRSSEKAAPHAPHRVLCDGPTKKQLGKAHAAPIPPTKQLLGDGVPDPRPNIRDA